MRVSRMQHQLMKSWNLRRRSDGQEAHRSDSVCDLVAAILTNEREHFLSYTWREAMYVLFLFLVDNNMIPEEVVLTQKESSHGSEEEH